MQRRGRRLVLSRRRPRRARRGAGGLPRGVPAFRRERLPGRPDPPRVRRLRPPPPGKPRPCKGVRGRDRDPAPRPVRPVRLHQHGPVPPPGRRPRRVARGRGVKVSVVVPTYHEEAGIEAFLRQFEDQTLPRSEFEVIVVDGGSTDATRAIAGRFADRVILQTSEGIGGGRDDGGAGGRAPLVAPPGAGCRLPRGWLPKKAPPDGGTPGG